MRNPKQKKNHRVVNNMHDNWLNRDPVLEKGFVNLQTTWRERRWQSFQKSPATFIFPNYYSFNRNNSLEFLDPFGLAPVLSPSGPPPSTPTDPGGDGGGDPCNYWAQQAMAAAAVLTQDPYNMTQQIKLGEALAAFKALGCDKPNIPPEEPCPTSKPPWWKRAGSGLMDILDRLGRIPIFIFDPCGPLGDPTLCPGNGPVMA